VTPVGARRAACRAGAAASQAGIALILALIVLAMMSLAAAALMRAVDTTTAVAGNLAFRAASIPAAGAAIEAALAALSDASVIADRERDLPAQNYYASRQPGEDARGVPWLLQRPGRDPAGARALDAGEGNTARYVIERVCLRPGPATAANCALAGNPPVAVDGSGRPEGGSAGAAGSGAGPTAPPAPVPLFRITVRVDGPQNTVSHVQAMVRDSTPPRRMSWRMLAE
jgi:Tfp pilus assembly protein PilX